MFNAEDKWAQYHKHEAFTHKAETPEYILKATVNNKTIKPCECHKNWLIIKYKRNSYIISVLFISKQMRNLYIYANVKVMNT
jgi:hypothetical protein